jgi:hypothetical protein
MDVRRELVEPCINDDGGITYLSWCYVHRREYYECLNLMRESEMQPQAAKPDLQARP